MELLQESKAYYVKSESVLDTKQEFKNADQGRVRSPIGGNLTLVKEGTHCTSFAFPVCPICSPYQYHQCYPYATTTKTREHFDQFQLQTLEHHYISHYNRSRKENRENGRESSHNRSYRTQERRSSVPSTNSFPSFHLKCLQVQRDVLTSSGSSKSSIGMPFAASSSHTLQQEQQQLSSSSPQQRHSSVSSASTSSRNRRNINPANPTTVGKGAVAVLSSSCQPLIITSSSSLITSSNSLISSATHSNSYGEKIILTIFIVMLCVAFKPFPTFRWNNANICQQFTIRIFCVNLSFPY